MAYMSQEKKKTLAPAIKAACKKHGVKATLAVDNHSTLILNIKSAPFDMIANFNEVANKRAAQRGQDQVYAVKDYLQVNVYHYQEVFSGKTLEFLSEVIPQLNVGNWDKSDIQSDYFNVGWYVSVNIGKWDQPFEVVA